MEDLTTSSLSVRAQSVRRMRHEARARVFEKEMGSLEVIRVSLGLRPSQICEILKVHPSAWIRWTRPGGRAPPHIFQMLEWYLELLDLRGKGRQPSVVNAVRANLSPREPEIPPNRESSSRNLLFFVLFVQVATLATALIALWRRP